MSFGPRTTKKILIDGTLSILMLWWTFRHKAEWNLFISDIDYTSTNNKELLMYDVCREVVISSFLLYVVVCCTGGKIPRTTISVRCICWPWIIAGHAVLSIHRNLHLAADPFAYQALVYLFSNFFGQYDQVISSFLRYHIVQKVILNRPSYRNVPWMHILHICCILYF